MLRTSTVRPRYNCLRFQILHAIYSQFSSLTSCQSRERPNPEGSFKNGLLSGLKSYYPSIKDECEEGVEFVMISWTHFSYSSAYVELDRYLKTNQGISEFQGVCESYIL